MYGLDSIAPINTAVKKNNIRDAHTPQPGEIVFNTMRYRSGETVQRSGYFQSSASYIKLQIMFKVEKTRKRTHLWPDAGCIHRQRPTNIV